METPPPDSQKLLATWMEWERGELPPGRVISNLKTGGLRELLEHLASAGAAAAATATTTTTGSTGEGVPSSGG